MKSTVYWFGKFGILKWTKNSVFWKFWHDLGFGTGIDIIEVSADDKEPQAERKKAERQNKNKISKTIKK